MFCISHREYYYDSVMLLCRFGYFIVYSNHACHVVSMWNMHSIEFSEWMGEQPSGSERGGDSQQNALSAKLNIHVMHCWYLFRNISNNISFAGNLMWPNIVIIRTLGDVCVLWHVFRTVGTPGSRYMNLYVGQNTKNRHQTILQITDFEWRIRKATPVVEFSRFRTDGGGWAWESKTGFWICDHSGIVHRSKTNTFHFRQCGTNVRFLR